MTRQIEDLLLAARYFAEDTRNKTLLSLIELALEETRSMKAPVPCTVIDRRLAA